MQKYSNYHKMLRWIYVQCALIERAKARGNWNYEREDFIRGRK